MEFQVRSEPTEASVAPRDVPGDAPAFGRVFTDHMVSVRWTSHDWWHDAEVLPYGPVELDPASVVLHYGQEVFEGLKAYRQPDGRVALFRPDMNARRMDASCRRLALPELPPGVFVDACKALVRADDRWVPSGEETSLYLRPFMFGDEVGLGVRPAASVRFLLIASPAGRYFTGPARPVSLWLSREYTRAAPGGTGAVKTGANYAASLAAQQEALAQGCDQVVFLDAAERRWVEELGGMNVFLVRPEGVLVTPALGTILPGVTRDSILALAPSLGLRVEERRVDVEEWRKGAADGSISEVFACGTAAVVTPVGALRWDGGEARTGDGAPGPVTAAVRSALLDVQYGRTPDPRGWLTPVS